jgi:hypothetical protein
LIADSTCRTATAHAPSVTATADNVTIRDRLMGSGCGDPTPSRFARFRGEVQPACHALSPTFQPVTRRAVAILARNLVKPSWIRTPVNSANLGGAQVLLYRRGWPRLSKHDDRACRAALITRGDVCLIRRQGAANRWCVPLGHEGPGLDCRPHVAHCVRDCEDRQGCRIAQGRARMRSAC